MGDEGKRLYTLRIEQSLLDAMDTLTKRDGVPVSEQIRRGIRMWLDEKGIEPKGATRRKTSRKK